MYEDKDFWPFKCPKCLKEFKEEIGRIKANAFVVCPDCGLRQTNHHKQFDLALSEAKAGRFDPWRDMFQITKSP